MIKLNVVDEVEVGDCGGGDGGNILIDNFFFRKKHQQRHEVQNSWFLFTYTNTPDCAGENLRK